MRACKGPAARRHPYGEQYAPGVCNDHTQFYQYMGADGGGMVKAGDWVGPPEGWVAPF